MDDDGRYANNGRFGVMLAALIGLMMWAGLFLVVSWIL